MIVKEYPASQRLVLFSYLFIILILTYLSLSKPSSYFLNYLTFFFGIWSALFWVASARVIRQASRLNRVAGTLSAITVLLAFSVSGIDVNLYPGIFSHICCLFSAILLTLSLSDLTISTSGLARALLGDIGKFLLDAFRWLLGKDKQKIIEIKDELKCAVAGLVSMAVGVFWYLICG